MNSKRWSPRTRPAVAHFIGPTGNGYRSFCENLSTPARLRFGCRIPQSFATLCCAKRRENTRSLVTFYVGQLEKTIPTSQEQLNVSDYSCVRHKGNVAQATSVQAAMVTYQTQSECLPARPQRMDVGCGCDGQAATRPLSPYTVEAYRQCAQEVRNIGAAPIFLITPSTTQITSPPKVRLADVVMAFISSSLSGLFRTGVRREGQHLTKPEQKNSRVLWR